MIPRIQKPKFIKILLLSILQLSKYAFPSPGGGHGHMGGGDSNTNKNLSFNKKNNIMKQHETTWQTYKSGVVQSCNQTTIAIYIPHESVMDPSSSQPVNSNMIFWSNDGSEHCRSRKYNETHYALIVDIANWEFPCGTNRDAETDPYRIRYSNSVGWVDPEKAGLDVLADVDCNVMKDKNVAVLPDSASKSDLETVWGKFSLKTTFYHDAEFIPAEALSTRDAAPKIQVGKPLFIKSEITSYPDEKTKDDMPDIALTVLNCLASKSPQFSNHLLEKGDKFTLKFVKDRCIGGDRTVIIRKNGQGSYSEFKFQMFKWKNTVNQYLYLHCNVAICNNKESNNQCSGQSENYMCHGDITQFNRKSSRKGIGSSLLPVNTQQNRNGRKKRDTEDVGYEIFNRSTREIPAGIIDERYITVHSFGPIIPWDTSVIAPTLDRTKEEQKLLDMLNHGIDPSNPPGKIAAKVVIGIVSVFSLISLVVLTSVVWKKFIKTRRWEEFMAPVQESKNEIEQGFVFVLRSSTDPVIPKDERQEEQNNNDSDNGGGHKKHKKKKKRRDKHGHGDDDEDGGGKSRRKKKKRNRKESMRHGHGDDGGGGRHKSRRRKTRDHDEEDEEDASPSRRHRGSSRAPNHEDEEGGHRRKRGKSRRPDREQSVIMEEPEEEEAAEQGRSRHKRERSERPRGRSEMPRGMSEVPEGDEDEE